MYSSETSEFIRKRVFKKVLVIKYVVKVYTFDEHKQATAGKGDQGAHTRVSRNDEAVILSQRF